MKSSFREVALHYFTTQVGVGMVQRIDGIECFSPLSGYWLWRIRLNRLVRRGDLIKKPIPSIWRSCNGMPGYGLATVPAPSLTA